MSSVGVIVLFVLTGVVMPIFLLSQVCGSSESAILDKSFSGCLKGLFAVYIALGHLVLLSEPSTSLLLPLQNFGYLCVAFFFMMSGYGLTLGYLKGGLKGFAKKRIFKIYVPYMVATLIIGLLYLAFMEDIKISDILIKALLMRPVYADRMLWYVFVQVLMYIFFWISFKFAPDKKNNLYKLLVLLALTLAYIAVCKVIHESLWSYKTVLCFPLGVGIALYKDKVISIIKKYFLIFVLPASVLCIIGFAFVCLNKHNFVMSIMSSFLFACVTLFLSYKFTTIKSKVLSFLGDISYEYYIFQLPIIHIVMHNIDAKIDYLYSPVIVLVTMVLALLAHKIADFICKKIDAIIL